MKKVYVLIASQKETTHLPITQFDASLDDLFKLSADFKNSRSLVGFYNDPEVKEIMIIVYDTKEGGDKKRRVIGIKKELSLEGAKEVFSDMLSDLGISAVFHSDEEIKKLIPFKKQDRDILKKIFQ